MDDDKTRSALADINDNLDSALENMQWGTADEQPSVEHAQASETDTAPETTQQPVESDESSEEAPSEASTTEPTEPTEPSQTKTTSTENLIQNDAPLTMDDLQAINQTSQRINNDYLKAISEANAQTLNDLVYAPDNTEWSVESLTGKDGNNGYINPQTKEVFTPNEAISFIQNNRYTLQQYISAMRQQAQEVSNTMMQASADSKYIQRRYGAALRDNPTLEQRIEQNFRKIAKFSDDGKYLVSTPISIRDFYDQALQGRSQNQSSADTANTLQDKTPPQTTATARDADQQIKANVDDKRNWGATPDISNKETPKSFDDQVESALEKMEW